MLDERLSLAAQLYEPCALGADIGTDHALLPCYLLTHNEMSMIDIAESVGFDNSLYFSRVFHKQMGMPPTEYARRHKPSDEKME